MAGAIRAAGAPVVMSGPQATETADEALGRSGGVRYADAVARGEADQAWPKIVEDTAQSMVKDIFAPADEFGQERKPTLQAYSWQESDTGTKHRWQGRTMRKDRERDLGAIFQRRTIAMQRGVCVRISSQLPGICGTTKLPVRR